MSHNNKGFTVIEVLCAMAVLTIGILALQMMQVKSIDENADAAGISSKSMMAASYIENIMRLKYDAVDLDDVDGDGDAKSHDVNLDGIDDSDPTNANIAKYDFGLHHYQCCQDNNDAQGIPVPGCVDKADHCGAYDQYDVYWNIAVDYPVKNTKTINIIVVNQKDKSSQTIRPVNRAEYIYVKDDMI